MNNKIEKLRIVYKNRTLCFEGESWKPGEYKGTNEKCLEIEKSDIKFYKDLFDDIENGRPIHKFYIS